LQDGYDTWHDAYARRQWNGLALLLALADPETSVAPETLADPEITFLPFSGAAVRPRYTGPLYDPRDVQRAAAGYTDTAAAPATAPGLVTRGARPDSMVRGAVYLMLSYGIQAALGFAFWLVAARLFSPDNVGTASSLISASILIGFLGLLGLNTTFVKFLPVAQDRNRLITAGLTLACVCGGAIALVYVLLTPLIAPRVSFIAHNPLLGAGFILLVAAGSVNSLTDSVFIGVGQAKYTAITDGIVGGATKLIAIVLLSGAGSYAIFGAASSSYVAAGVVSLILMVRGADWRPRFTGLLSALKPVLVFSGANYVANVFNLLPNLIVPLIVIDRIGAASAAYYYVAYQLASLLYQTVFAVESSFLAQGAQSHTIEKSFLVRSIRILAVVCIPAFAVMLLIGHYLLLLFGAKYAGNAGGCYNILIAAVLPIAVNNWLLTVLRLADRLHAIVVSNFVYLVVVCGLAWFLAPQGLNRLALAWPIGIVAGGLVAAVAALPVLRGIRPARR
jgi:O-antigen/teichoic acid export membrane protein